jgi:hypothetical protein
MYVSRNVIISVYNCFFYWIWINSHFQYKTALRDNTVFINKLAVKIMYLSTYTDIFYIPVLVNTSHLRVDIKLCLLETRVLFLWNCLCLLSNFVGLCLMVCLLFLVFFHGVSEWRLIINLVLVYSKVENCNRVCFTRFLNLHRFTCCIITYYPFIGYIVQYSCARYRWF